MELTTIIKLCKENNPKGQRALVGSYASLLMTVGRRYAMNHYGPEDILQDAFINIFKNIHQYDNNRGSFEGWMRRIVVNTALGMIRKRKLQTSTLSDEEYELKMVPPTVYEQYNAEELMLYIDALPEQYRLVFNLSCIEGYSHKEISNMLQIAEASSRSNLSRAKAILRNKILENKNEASWVRTG